MHNTIAYHPLIDAQLALEQRLPIQSYPYCFERFFCMTPYGMKYPFGQLRSPLLALSPPDFMCPLGPPHWQGSMRRWKPEMSLALCSTTQQQLKHRCVISILWVTNLKHNSIQATMKNNSIPARPSTQWYHQQPQHRGKWPLESNSLKISSIWAFAMELESYFHPDT